MCVTALLHLLSSSLLLYIIINDLKYLEGVYKLKPDRCGVGEVCTSQPSHDLRSDLGLLAMPHRQGVVCLPSSLYPPTRTDFKA